MPGGADKDVSAEELGDWVEEVTRAILVDSVIKQVEAIVKGKRQTSNVHYFTTFSVLSFVFFFLFLLLFPFSFLLYSFPFFYHWD